MTGPHPAVAATRVAVRRRLIELCAAGDGSVRPHAGASISARSAGDSRPLVLVACSGGPDSLALAAATAFEAPRAGVQAGAVVVDHRLQPGSAQVADTAAAECRSLGLDPVEVIPADVAPDTGLGPEGAARQARHDELAAAATRLGATAVLFGHTRDDQAEQVLLGLVRGSGARSLAGMPVARGLIVRPFLELPRALTLEACRQQQLTPWHDPHNQDARFTRTRVRRALTHLESSLGPGIGTALSRSARLLRQDADALDGYAAAAFEAIGAPPLSVAQLQRHPLAVRARVWRLAAQHVGVPVGRVSARHVSDLDALITAWSGQGPVTLPGGYQARRRGSLVHLEWSGPVE